MILGSSGRFRSLLAVMIVFLSGEVAVAADSTTPAKQLFGAVTLPNGGAPTPYGFYSKGCMAGGVAIPADGPTWQAMRLSRNRRWGNPRMIALIEKLSRDAAKFDGWPGLLIGDISQPRGGPMLTGHASHQIGLDADIWLTPMPSRTLSADERENISATSMLQKNTFLKVDPTIWTPAHARLLMRAASYPQVERMFVNPAIKKKLCETWTGDRTVMGKIRPYYGHDYHFHIRIKCPQGAKDCKPQAPVAAGDGCDKSLAWWFTDEPWAKPGKKPDADAPKPRPVMLSDLPKACAIVLNSAPVASRGAATFGGSDVGPDAVTPTAAPAAQTTQNAPQPPADIPVPRARPAAN